MAVLYGVDVGTINELIKKNYAGSELAEAATIRKFRIVQTEGTVIKKYFIATAD